MSYKSSCPTLKKTGSSCFSFTATDIIFPPIALATNYLRKLFSVQLSFHFWQKGRDLLKGEKSLNVYNWMFSDCIVFKWGVLMMKICFPPFFNRLSFISILETDLRQEVGDYEKKKKNRSCLSALFVGHLKWLTVLAVFFLPWGGVVGRISWGFQSTVNLFLGIYILISSFNKTMHIAYHFNSNEQYFSADLHCIIIPTKISFCCSSNSTCN